jgi:hypothetical protein
MKKEQNLSVLLYIAKLLSGCDDLFAIVVATLSAHMMRHLGLVALGAGNETRGLQLPVGTAAVAAGLGHFSLGNCHFWFTSGVMQYRKFSTDDWLMLNGTFLGYSF